MHLKFTFSTNNALMVTGIINCTMAERGNFACKVRVFQPKVEQNSNLRRNCFTNFRLLHLDCADRETAEDAINKCAKNCKISPLFVPLFGLWNEKTNLWIKPSALLESINGLSDTIFEFRIRFSFTSVNDVNNPDLNTVYATRYSVNAEEPKRIMCEPTTEYYFFQERHDFLNDKFKLSPGPNNDVIEAALGIGILDLFRLSLDINSRKIKQIDYKKLLPQSIRDSIQHMGLIKRLRVKYQFNHCFKEFDPRRHTHLEISKNQAHEMYIRSLELVSNNQQHVEHYKCVDKSTCEYVEVSADQGIVICKENIATKWCDIVEVTDLNIEARARGVSSVIVSKMDGEIIEIDLNNLDLAENLATCIDGYYRLLVDYHHYLCKDIAPPSLIRMENICCFGPISIHEAEEISRRKKNPKQHDCLLRSSWKTPGEYYITSISSVGTDGIHFRNYQVELNSDNQLQLYGSFPGSFESIEKVLEAIRKSDLRMPFDLNNMVLPNVLRTTSLLVKRLQDYNNPPFPRTRPQQFLDDNGQYDLREIIGSGKFTETSLRISQKNGNEVVFKKIGVLSDNCSNDLGFVDCIKTSFKESTNDLRHLDHKHIIKLIEYSMDGYVVLEYAPNKSVIEYMKSGSRSFSVEWTYKVFWQLAHACNYLEISKLAHGKIRGQNVLLFHDDESGPFIKLSDSGVKVHRVEHNSAAFINEPVLPVPWLAYEFCKVDHNPVESKPTVNGDKWSFATTICEICSRDDLQAINPYQMSDENKQAYRTNSAANISEQISENSTLEELIKACWNKNSENRPTYRKILRELGNTLCSGYISNQAISLVRKPNVTSQIPAPFETATYEDRKLFKRRSLGSGNFGTVELYGFDRYGNGEIEKVAIKELRRPGNWSQSEFEREFQTMRRIRHNHVVELKGLAVPSRRIVMEYLPEGSLADALRRSCRRPIPIFAENDLYKFCAQIADAMFYLQNERRIIHRDLALRNILLDKKDGEYFIKVSDFGLSRFLTADEENIEEVYYRFDNQVIPVYWYAPECIAAERRIYLMKSDVWSYGVTIWEVFSNGARPFYPYDNDISSAQQLQQLSNNLKDDNYRLRKPNTGNCTDAVYAVMRRCWQYEPQSRCGFDELREFFSNLHSQC